MKLSNFYFLLLLLFSLSISAQKYIVTAETLSEVEMKNLEKTIPKDGWVLLKTNTGNFIMNYSNRDYILRLGLKCSEPSQEPNFLIEYSDKYRDGDFEGIDLVSSDRMDYAKIIFFLDNKDYKNPFSNTANENFSNFQKNMKTAKILTIKLYDNEMNPNTGKDELKLNRSIDFQLKNGEVLDFPVNCG